MPKDEFVSLNYAKRLPIYDFEKPYQIISDLPGIGNLKRSNIEFSSSPELECIHDLREQEHLYGLDSHGFQILKHQFSVNNWSEKQDIENKFLPEVERLIVDHLFEADEVFIFNWRKRKNTPYKDEGIREIDLEDGSHYVLPADFVHIDLSSAAALQEVQLCMGERASKLLQGRVRIVNFWKPICPYPVQDAPLALCDGASILNSDLFAADHIRRKHDSETLMLVHRPGFRWHYLSNQTEDECYLFKIFDSLETVQAKYCPHTSFQHRVIPPGCPPRESIEVRALVFTYAREE